MSRNYVERLYGNFNRGQKMMDGFLESCPDELWTQTLGGYPVWLQYYHLMACVESLVMGKDEAPKHQLYDMETLFMSKFPEKAMSKAEVSAYNAKMKEYFAAYMDKMTDELLLQPHEGASLRLKTPMKHIDVIEMLIAHVFYHLGTFDGILRDRKLKGMYGI